MQRENGCKGAAFRVGYQHLHSEGQLSSPALRFLLRSGAGALTSFAHTMLSSFLPFLAAWRGEGGGSLPLSTIPCAGHPPRGPELKMRLRWAHFTLSQPCTVPHASLPGLPAPTHLLGSIQCDRCGRPQPRWKGVHGISTHRKNGITE